MLTLLLFIVVFVLGAIAGTKYGRGAQWRYDKTLIDGYRDLVERWKRDYERCRVSSTQAVPHC